MKAIFKLWFQFPSLNLEYLNINQPRRNPSGRIITFLKVNLVCIDILVQVHFLQKNNYILNNGNDLPECDLFIK